MEARTIKVISGGQTGVDQAALEAAIRTGHTTGGTAPKGYRTETGPNLALRDIYGLSESRAEAYQPRTLQNIKDGDVTLILAANDASSGTRLTIYGCEAERRPYLVIRKYHAERMGRNQTLFTIEDWLRYHKPTVLNVAGNRESTNPGIYNWALSLLEEAFTQRKE